MVSFLCSKWSSGFSSHAEEKPKSFRWCTACSMVLSFQPHLLLIFPLLMLRPLSGLSAVSQTGQAGSCLRAFAWLWFTPLGRLHPWLPMCLSPSSLQDVAPLSASLDWPPYFKCALHPVWALSLFICLTLIWEFILRICLFYVPPTRMSTSWRLRYLSVLFTDVVRPGTGIL